MVGAKRRWAVALAALWVTAAAGSARAHGQSARDDAWRADLSELTERLEARHPNPYHRVTRVEFAAALDRVADRVGEAEDYEIVVGLARLMARVGDGHTGTFLPFDFDYGRYPLELWHLDDGLLVAAATPEYAKLVGGRVVSIGGRAVSELLPSADSLVSRDNDYALRGPRRLLMIPEVLASLDVIEAPGPVDVDVEDSDGSRTSLRVRPMGPDAAVRWTWGGGGEPPPWLRDREARYWFEPLPEHRAVYFQYNDASWEDESESLLAFTDRLESYVAGHDVERVIVDLRWNDGGSDRWTNIVLHALTRIEHGLGNPRTQDRAPGPPLFVLIGPVTFSAATSFALDLEEHTNAVFVGEPTGGRPVGYGGQSFIDLSRTGTRLRSSFRYQISSFPGDDRAALFPHVAAPPTIADYRAGRDPGLEAALAWRGGESVAERMEAAVRSGGLVAARAAWRAWRNDPSNRWLDPESEINAAGYRLLGEDDPEAAVVLFRINAEAHPRSANAHDSLGEGLVAIGARDEAVAVYERAAALDPDGRIGANARRMIERLRDGG